MTAFVLNTIDDLRHGRESWRVVLSTSLAAFLVGAILAIMRSA